MASQLTPLRLASFAASLCLFGFLLPSQAQAGAPTCTISASSISFGNVDVLPGTAVDVTATLTVSCSGGSGNGQRLCISIGSGSVFTGSQRQMSGPGGALLNYELYKDAARTTVWGSWQTGFNGSGLQYDIPQYGTRAVTVYGRLFASQQTAVAGSYSSTFTGDFDLQYADKGTASCPTGNKFASSSTSATVTVLSSCSVTATSLNFGSSGFLTANVDGTAQLRPHCTNGVPYTISLDGGLAAAADPTQRKMSKAAEQISYGLYRDSARSLPWGNVAGSNTAAGSGTGLAQTLPVYGRVPAQSTGSPGTYSDTIVVSVDY